MRYLYVVLGLTLAGCGPNAGFGEDGSVVADDPDAATNLPDARPPRPDAEPFDIPDAGNVFEADALDLDAMGACGQDWVCQSPVPDGCNVGGTDVCGNGLDDNCNGEIDEGCTCAPGSVQPCFAGPPGKRNVGACTDGQQTCQGSGEFTYWGPCQGGIVPTGEACDNLDNDCNGCGDDHPFCCDVDLTCPAPGDLPDGQPFTDYVIDGTQFWPGAATNWQWTVTGGPCDQLLDATTGVTSYTVSGANTNTMTLTPTLSGDYTVSFTADTPTGPIGCTFIVHVRGPGLRFELCWDTTGQTDLDLHVHRDGTTTPWFTKTSNGNSNPNSINPDDCYFANCKAAPHSCTGPNCVDVPDWGLANSNISECEGGPEGAMWQALGFCANPRLDVDNISTAGRPENINIDVPNNGGTYRAMVHYFGPLIIFGNGIKTAPMVNVYCGGRLRSTFGAAPDLVGGFDNGGGFAGGPMWRVADVTPVVDTNGVTTDCTVTPLHPPGQTSGYWVTNGDRSY